MAPEVLLGRAFNEKADVYSFGLVLWALVTRSEPYAEHTAIDTFVDAVCVRGSRPHVPVECKPLLRRLIYACWDMDPNNRPGNHSALCAVCVRW